MTYFSNYSFVIYKFPYYEARDETGVRLVNGIDKCIEIDDVRFKLVLKLLPTKYLCIQYYKFLIV